MSVGRLTIVLLFAAATASAQPQVGAPAWTGYVRCNVDVKGPGYVNHQTHTWTLTGAPAPGGSALDYPGTWSVTGEGAMQSATQPGSTWTTKGSAPGVRMAIFVRQADQRLVVFLRHAPLTAPGATAIVREPSTRSLAPVTEWRPFPTIADDPKNARVMGSSTNPITARLDAMQPPGSAGVAACSWDLGSTGAASTASASSGGAAGAGTPIAGAVVPQSAPAAVATAKVPAPTAVVATPAPVTPAEPTPTVSKPVLSGCAAADAKVVTVSRGQSQTVTGTLKSASSLDWLTLRFAPGTSVRLTLNNSAPAKDASDFQLQAFSDCSSMIVMTTGIGPKTLEFPDSGPHTVIIRIVASQWQAATPTYSLKLEGR